MKIVLKVNYSSWILVASGRYQTEKLESTHAPHINCQKFSFLMIFQ